MLSNHRSTPPQEQQSFLSCLESQMNYPVAQRHWAVIMPETVPVASCSCIFCRRHFETDEEANSGRVSMQHRSESHAHCPLPSTRSILQVLYPPPYLGTPRPFPNPPSYFPSDSLRPAGEDDAETYTFISSTETSIQETYLPHSPPDPLAQDPALTGVPSQESSSGGVQPVEPNPPVISFGGDVSDESELPPYSRFDQRRSRFPVASDALGPYPPLSVLCQAAR